MEFLPQIVGRSPSCSPQFTVHFVTDSHLNAKTIRLFNGTVNSSLSRRLFLSFSLHPTHLSNQIGRESPFVLWGPTKSLFLPQNHHQFVLFSVFNFSPSNLWKIVSLSFLVLIPSLVVTSNVPKSAKFSRINSVQTHRLLTDQWPRKSMGFPLNRILFWCQASHTLCFCFPESGGGDLFNQLGLIAFN